MGQQGEGIDASYGDGVRDLELAVPEVRSGRTQDAGELVRNHELLAVIHAHGYKEVGMTGRGRQRLGEVVVA